MELEKVIRGLQGHLRRLRRAAAARNQGRKGQKDQRVDQPGYGLGNDEVSEPIKTKSRASPNITQGDRAAGMTLRLLPRATHNMKASDDELVQRGRRHQGARRLKRTKKVGSAASSTARPAGFPKVTSRRSKTPRKMHNGEAAAAENGVSTENAAEPSVNKICKGRGRAEPPRAAAVATVTALFDWSRRGSGLRQGFDE